MRSPDCARFPQGVRGTAVLPARSRQGSAASRCSPGQLGGSGRAQTLLGVGSGITGCPTETDRTHRRQTDKGYFYAHVEYFSLLNQCLRISD